MQPTTQPIPRREPLLPWAGACVVALVGVALVAFGRLRLGGYVLASAFALAALLRGVLPGERAGALAVRGRVADIGLWSGLALAVAVGTWLVNIPPPGA